MLAPAAQTCPYANICETCDNFVPAPEFAPALRDQLTDIRELQTDALRRGWTSEVERHDRVIESLEGHLERLDNVPDLAGEVHIPRWPANRAAQQGDRAPHRGGRHLPDRASVIRLVGMIVAEVNDEWHDGRRYFRPEEMASSMRLNERSGPGIAHRELTDPTRTMSCCPRLGSLTGGNG